MSPERLRLILRRDEHPASYDPGFFEDKRVLVTGAAGTIGEALAPILYKCGALVADTDKDTLDVTHPDQMSIWMSWKPQLVFHLAAQKHAPEAEERPDQTMLTNTVGTMNLLDKCRDAHVVLASTCKAIQPETVYGATKLVAERLVLNAGGTVVRLFNVVPASGNVFEIWEQTDEPVPVTDCYRYFISQQEAACALLAAAQRPPGRYTPNPGSARHMPAVAADLEYDTYTVPPRRGDRLVEPLKGMCENAYPDGDLYRVVSQHDALHDRADSIFERQP